jgi:outer membrane protein assembly factor BamA
MRGKKKYCFCVWLAVASFYCLLAQGPGGETSLLEDQTNQTGIDQNMLPEDSLFTIRHIFIEGNKKTRASIILREIPLHEGSKYSLPDVVRKFETSRRQLMNTLLFHEAVVALKSFEGYNIDVIVRVKERWYIFPIPYFKPVDRNLNQWLFEQKASFDRVDYGLKLLYNNVTGRNDKLTVWGVNGYTKQFSFTYDRLYFDKKMKWGYTVGFAIGKNREVNYNSVDNKQVFLKDGGYLRNFNGGFAELTYRNAIKTRHRFGIAYRVEEVADTVLKLNSSYFRSGQTRIEYPELYYTMNYFNVDYIPYPTKGYLGKLDVNKKGLNSTVNLFQVSLQASGYWHTGRKSFVGLESYGMIKLPFSQPYFNRRFLGYGGNNLQGYEYYVIDGVAGGYLKASFVRKILSFDINMRGTKALTPGKIPFTFYAKIYGNTGYIYNPDKGTNSLANRFLYSSGIGIDVITLYDFILKLEWSFNQLGQNGVFLHPRSIF